MPDHLKNALIRVYTMDMRRNHGNVVVAEVMFRRVSFYPLSKPGQSFNVPGAVLIDAPDALSPVAAAIQRNVGMLVMIHATDQLIWTPVKAEMSIAEYWTIELVPWIDYLRASSVDDDEILRKAHEQ